MTSFIYVFAICAENTGTLAKAEAAVGTKGTPPKPKKTTLGGTSMLSTGSPNIVASKYDHLPEDTKVFFFASPVFDDPAQIDGSPYRALLTDSDDWVLLRI